jgi:LmbE family N-acetylglucosaminyl deacetylase
LGSLEKKEMMNLKLSTRGDSLKVLCVGAHSDDIEIGCGGTVLKLVEKYKSTLFYWVVLGSEEERKREAEESANAFLADAKDQTVTIKEFKDGYFPYAGNEIKEYFEELKREVDPDLIFTHHRLDLHQDHRLVSDLTWNTFRDHLILEYEIPKYDGDLGAPNVFVHLDEAICRAKIQHILNFFKTQAENQWFTEETFRAILRLRGIESNAPTQYAEAFHSRKLILV